MSSYYKNNHSYHSYDENCSYFYYYVIELSIKRIWSFPPPPSLSPPCYFELFLYSSFLRYFYALFSPFLKELRRSDEFHAAEDVKSAAQIVAETKAVREKKIRESTIDSVTGGVAMNFYMKLAEEQVQ